MQPGRVRACSRPTGRAERCGLHRALLLVHDFTGEAEYRDAVVDVMDCPPGLSECCMKTCLMMIVFCLASAGGVMAAESAGPVHWPGGAVAAVSLTYDDALDSQLDHAAPALQRHGLGATFYLTVGGRVVSQRLAAWRALAAQGFELGNHTLYHGCSKSEANREWVNTWDDLDHQSLEQLQRDIRTANTLLQAIDGRTRRTFATPCFDYEVGGEYYLDDIAGDFVALRDLEHGMPQDSRVTWVPVEASGAELIDFVQANTRPGALLILVFHGVGGDHMAVSAGAHEELLAFLAANRDRYWTESYLNIMEHVLGAAQAPGVNR